MSTYYLFPRMIYASGLVEVNSNIMILWIYSNDAYLKGLSQPRSHHDAVLMDMDIKDIEERKW